MLNEKIDGGIDVDILVSNHVDGVDFPVCNWGIYKSRPSEKAKKILS